MDLGDLGGGVKKNIIVRYNFQSVWRGNSITLFPKMFFFKKNHDHMTCSRLSISLHTHVPDKS
jgi:hypothetical protein